MRRYFFDFDDSGAEHHRDDIGTEMESANDIPAEAVGTLVAIVKDRLPDGPSRVFNVAVRDEDGSAVFKAKLTLETSWQ